jgi:3-hexulose-6-phosphate synthase
VKLQVALDFVAGETALKVAAAVARYVDIIEAGTPLIKAEGVHIISELRRAHGDKEILADLKTMDTGYLEAELAFLAGADIVTVCGAADDATVSGAVTAAREYRKLAMVDLIGVRETVCRAREILALDADLVGIHAGIDEQNKGVSILATLEKFDHIPRERISVAGGINLNSIDSIAGFRPAVIVVGGAITKADRPERIAAELRARMSM